MLVATLCRRIWHSWHWAIYMQHWKSTRIRLTSRPKGSWLLECWAR